MAKQNYSQHLHHFARLLADDELPLAEQVHVISMLSQLQPEGVFLADCVALLREYALPLSLSKPCFDIVGTGADGQNTFNISTLAAIFLAKAGIPVAKHGNRASTSACGSMDLLEQLGIHPAQNQKEAEESLAKSNLVFLSAPDYYPVLTRLRPARQLVAQRGQPTFFNLLGPLAHPAKVKLQIIGVYHPGVMSAVATAMQRLGIEYGAVIHGQDHRGAGCDELILSELNHVLLIESQQLTSSTLSCRQFGLNPCEITELKGGSAEINAGIARNILSHQAKASQRDVVLLNAAFGFFIANLGKKSLEECYRQIEQVEKFPC